MGPSFSRKYNTLLVAATAIYLPMVKRAVVDYAVSADWTPAAGDVKVSIDGGAAANITNLPTAITMGNTAMWQFILTAAELSGKQIMVTVADSATKAVEDQMFIVETYGNASAYHQQDFGAANWQSDIAAIGGSTTALTSFKEASLATMTGSVSAATSTTSFTINTTVTAADQFKGRIITFDQNTTTPSLRGQATDITANTVGGVLTVTALTVTPSIGDTFCIT